MKSVHSALCAAALTLTTACNQVDRTRSPVNLLTDAMAAMGNRSALAAAGPFTIHASGALDKSAEGQGRSPGIASPAPYREAIAVDPLGDAVLWDYRENRYDDTQENFGEAYPTDTLRYLLIHDVGIAVPFTDQDFRRDRMRLRRRIPHLLIDELLTDPEQLRVVQSDQDTIRIAGTIADSIAITVSLSPTSLLLQSLQFQADIPGRGETSIEWWYDEYQVVAPNMRVPHRYGSRVNDLLYTEMSVDSVTFHSGAVFQPPGNLRVLDVRHTSPDSDSDVALEIEELAPNVFVVHNVRSGFAPLVVEFDTFLLVVDAPASFPLLGQIPPSETDPGPSMSWATERLVDTVGRHWPDKAIAFAALTHHHDDHVGGIRALVAAGATILAAPPTIAVVRRLVELPAQDIRDHLTENPAPLRFEVIDGVRSISDGTQTIDLIPVAGNPHADGMVIVSLPRLNTLYVSDIMTAGPIDDYPRPNHAALDRWFADWLIQSDMTPESIWTMHGSGALTRLHLDLLSSRSH